MKSMKHRLVGGALAVAVLFLAFSLLTPAHTQGTIDRDMLSEVRKIAQQMERHDRLLEEQNRQIKRIADYLERRELRKDN